MATTKKPATKPTTKPPTTVAVPPPTMNAFALAAQKARPVDLIGGGTAVYVQFAHSQADNWREIQATPGGNNVRNGQPVLINSHLGKIIFLAPTFEFILMEHLIQYWCDMDSTGKMIKTYPEPERKATEFVDAAVIVLFKGDMVPASMRCRGPKTPGIKRARETLNDVDTDEWKRRGKDCLFPSTVPQLANQKWAWYINTATITSTQPKTAGGRPYETMTTEPRPITPIEAKTLINLSGTAEFVEQLGLAMDSITRRQSEVESKY